MKPRVLMVTRIPFWRLGSGERMRILAMAWILGAQTELTVLYLDAVEPLDASLLKQLRVNCHLVSLAQAQTSNRDPSDELKTFTDLCAARQFDVCIFQKIQLHFLLNALPPGVRSVLDTHDLHCVKAESKAVANVPQGDELGEEAEMAMLCQYDRVLLIQADDYARCVARLGLRAMLVPHPVSFAALPVVAGRFNLGLVASAWVANLHGLDWFSQNVWPHIAAKGVEVHLFGGIGDIWQPDTKDFHRHGFVADFKLAWGAIDVAINPVQWGSGLKIKTVEALGHGLPLVTTTEGARGLGQGANRAFRLADKPMEFAGACNDLLGDLELRTQFGISAHQFATRHFSPQVCFSELVRWMKI